MEVLLKAARGWADLENGDLAAPRTWLYRVAANHCVDYLRRRNWRRARMQLYAGGQPYGLTPEADGDRAPFPPGDDAVRILALLSGRLNREERRILDLLMETGLRKESVARILGVSRGTVGRRIARIRGRALEIRSALEGISDA